MKSIHSLLLVGLLALSACSGSHRPVYTGHQESTEGVPGFKNGKKISPHVKLGQSYRVDGETYVPRHQPDYVEEGLASWYGPGFHGGKTANGEVFNKNDMTAAHRTLPLPSMVRVTIIETGKSTIVRVNDRGPFSKGRIIDLSRAAAEKIGLIGKGVAKVRVEYLDQETKRFTGLLADGRAPDSIDVDNEVLGASVNTIASNAAPYSSAYDSLEKRNTTPINLETNDAANVDDVSVSDLSPPATATKPIPSPFAALEKKTSPTEIMTTDAPVVHSATLQGLAHYLQLGAFANQENAERLRAKVKTIGAAAIDAKTIGNASTLFVVRMGPYTDVDESTRVLAQLNGLGINSKTVSK